MLQKKYLILSLVCLSSLLGCKQGPKVTVCVSNPEVAGFECFNQVTQTSFYLNYNDSDHYVALSPNDAQALFDFCAQNKPNLRREFDIDENSDSEVVLRRKVKDN